ncbi:MAG TPA: PPOX class F420-dependent oxidoreductase [Pseudonocardia sp.]|jgi:hypothetical protein
MDEIARLSKGSYVLLTTFRRDGRAVPTPVWLAREADALLVWSGEEAGKVKRIRRSPEVRLAPCNSRGKPTGPEVAGHAELLGPEESLRARAVVLRRYGLLGWLTGLGSRIRHGRPSGAGIRITVPGEAG